MDLSPREHFSLLGAPHPAVGGAVHRLAVFALLSAHFVLLAGCAAWRAPDEEACAFAETAAADVEYVPEQEYVFAPRKAAWELALGGSEAARPHVNARMRGLKVIIAGAGMSAALPGVAAAHSDLPVIGVPILGKSLGGLDALLSAVQMPPGIPVACVAIDGAKNAGILAAQIMSTADDGLAARIASFKEGLAAKVGEGIDALRQLHPNAFDR